jgi:hypothetical protein
MTETPRPPDERDQTPPDAPDPVPPPAARTSKWGWRKTAIVAAVAVGIAGVGGAVVWAAVPHHDRGPGGGVERMGPPGPVGRMGPGGPVVLHGEAVIEDGNGDYVTRLTQTGEVTAISDTSVTARSEDGYTKTYVVTSETRVGAIEVGDDAVIVGTVVDGTATARTIADPAGPGRRGGPGPGGR